MLVAVRRHRYRRGSRSLNVNYGLVKKRSNTKNIPIMARDAVHLELCSSSSQSGNVESGWLTRVDTAVDVFLALNLPVVHCSTHCLPPVTLIV